MNRISKKITAIVLALIIAVAIVPVSGLNIKVSATSGSEIVEYARTFLGYPYVSGGKGPDAFDCSGFASYVYGHFGIYLPNSTTEIWNNREQYGTVVGHGSTENAQEGDLIVWVGHVSIYTSNGGCVEALNPRYGVTEALPVNTHTNGMDYYVLHINGVDGMSKPAAPVITVDKTSAQKSDKVTVSWEPVEGATSYRVDCSLWPLPFIDETTTATSYTMSFPMSGNYSLIVYAINGAGETQSNRITLNITPDKSSGSDGTEGGIPTDIIPDIGNVDASVIKTVLDTIVNFFKLLVGFLTNVISFVKPAA